MKTPFGPKSNVIIVRISALLYNRAEILTIITLLFGPNGVYIELFRFLLTLIPKPHNHADYHSRAVRQVTQKNEERGSEKKLFLPRRRA